MATFRNAQSASFSAASGSVTKPTGVVSGDVQLAFISGDTNSGTLGISGGATWSQVGTTQAIGNGDTQRFALFRQVAGGTEPASYTVSNSAGNSTSALILAYSGVDNVTPIAAQLATNPNSVTPPASPVSIAANAITTPSNNQTVVFFATVDWNAATAAAFTDPASTTRRAVQTPAQFSNALACDFVKAVAGSTGTITGTGTLATKSGNFGAWLVALNDAAAASTDETIHSRIFDTPEIVEFSSDGADDTPAVEGFYLAPLADDVDTDVGAEVLAFPEWTEEPDPDDPVYMLPWSQAPPIADNNPDQSGWRIYSPEWIEEVDPDADAQDHLLAPLAGDVIIDDSVAVNETQLWTIACCHWVDEDDWQDAQQAPLADDNDLPFGAASLEDHQSDEWEPEGDALGPLPDDLVVDTTLQGSTEDSSDQQEDEETEFDGTAVAPLPDDNDPLPPAPSLEDHASDEYEVEPDSQAPLAPDNDVALGYSAEEHQSDEWEPEGESCGPLPAELVLEDFLLGSSEFATPEDVEDEETGFDGFCLAPTPDDNFAPPVVPTDTTGGGWKPVRMPEDRLAHARARRKKELEEQSLQQDKEATEGLPASRKARLRKGTSRPLGYSPQVLERAIALAQLSAEARERAIEADLQQQRRAQRALYEQAIREALVEAQRLIEEEEEAMALAIALHLL